MKRYEWEDALIESQAQNHIDNGALLVLLKLAKAINWSPKDGRPAGLYWNNDSALKQVGCGRATFYKHKKSLVETGFIEIRNGNVIPCLPESTLETVEESTGETNQSTVETLKSTPWTQKSTGDNTLSVDTFSEDVLSVDNSPSRVKEDSGPKAHGAEAPVGIESSFLTSENQPFANEVKKTPKSTVETLTPERRFFLTLKNTYKNQPPELWEAVEAAMSLEEGLTYNRATQIYQAKKRERMKASA